jgi:PAS domain S-box-containing protein
MNPLTLHPEDKKTAIEADFSCLKNEFDTLLSFVSDSCTISHACVTSIIEGIHTINTAVGLGFVTNPNDIVCYQEFVAKKEIFIVSGIKEDTRFQSQSANQIVLPKFDFFAGFPIINKEGVLIATLCIMDENPKELSAIELKILNQAVNQIQSLLELKHKNDALQGLIKQKENQFQLFIESSNEIFYELTPEGIFTSVTNSWITLLGYTINEVEGESFVKFVHPDDLEKCFSFLESVLRTGKRNDELVYRVLHKEGYYVWHASNGRLLKKEDGIFYIGVARDVTEYIQAQDKLILQKEFYEKILDRLPIGVAVFNKDYKYTYLNPSSIKNEELRKVILGKDDFEYAEYTKRDATFAKTRKDKYIEAVNSKKVLEWEDELKQPNGDLVYHIRKVAPVFDAEGNFELMVGYGIDITENKRIQNEIIKSRYLTQSIIQNAAVGILVQGPQSEIIENNKAACDLLGLTEDQLLGKTSFDSSWKVIHLDETEFRADEHPVPRAIKELEAVKNVIMGVFHPLKNDFVWLLVDAIPVFDDQNKLVYVICTFKDITEQKNAVSALNASNERFTYSSQATSDAIWDWDIISDEIFVGKNYTELFGHRFENNIITSKECENFVHPEDRKRYLDYFDAILEQGDNKWSDEYRYLKADGTYAYVKDKAIIIRNTIGEPIRIIGAMQDITKEKKLKDELQQSEEKFKGAFDLSAVGMALVNSNGYWEEANDRICEILGYTKEELNNLTVFDITYPDDLEEDLENQRKLDSGEIPNFSMEKRYIHKNKSIVWAHLTVSIVKNNEGEIKYYIPQIIDITDRKRFEEQNKLLVEENNRNRAIQLNEAKNMYRLLAENTADLVCLHNLDTSFQYVSPSIKGLLGYAPEEIVGKFPLEFVHPEDAEKLKIRYTNFISDTESNAQDFRFRNINGDYIWLEITANIVYENEIPVNFQSSARDITQRKESEEATEKALLKERELNELRTNLVSTISHEFRTPMTTIRTSSELIEMYLEDQEFEKKEKLNKQLNTISGEIDRIIELMNAVLTISKDDSGKTNFNPSNVNLKQLCLDVIETSFSNQKDLRKVQTVFKGINFNVFADKNLMVYSLFNILNNAFKYSEGTTDVQLALSVKNSKIELKIIDFGIGIPEQDQPKLFNTFFRASNTNGIQGTGLGLYIVKTFTEKNSGNIKLVSELGKGTQVTMRFPLLK